MKIVNKIYFKYKALIYRGGGINFIKYIPQAFLLHQYTSLGLLIFIMVVLKPEVGFTQKNTLYKYYDINKIQSNEVIKGITKDDKGFIWLATDQGVLRFDGRETVMFYKELPSPYTKKLLKRENGELLVITDFGIKEIVRNADTTFFRPMQVNGNAFSQTLNYPKSIFEDSEGNLWIGEVNAVVKISDKGFKRYFLGNEYQSINYHRSFSFTEDAFGHIWIAPYNGRLLSYNAVLDSLEDVDINYPISSATGIATVKGDYLVIGGKEGVLKLKIDSDKKILQNDFIGGPENISTLFSLGNNVYIGTWGNGLYHFSFNELPYKISPVPDVSFSDILDFYYDQQQDEIWLAGSENLGLLKPSLVNPIDKPGKFRIESLTIDNAGKLYFSTGEEIFSRSMENIEDAQFIFSSKTTYFDRIQADGDKIWIGDAFGRISYYDLSQQILHRKLDSTANAINYILKDKEGNKWFSGLPQGLVKIDTTDSIRTYSRVKRSMVVKESEKGKLFCGAQGKDSLLYLYDKAKDAFDLLNLEYTFQASPGIRVEDMAFDSLGNPWLATNEGLLKVNGTSGRYKAERVFLRGIDINEPIKAIAITKDNIWLAYSYALALYHQGQVIFYTRENGLPSRLLKERSFQVHNNKLYIGTAKGLAQVNMESIRYSATPQPIFKTILVNGKKWPISGNGSVTFPYGSRVQVEFVSLSYPGANILYQTKLSGLEREWSEASANSSISVLGFSEGPYTLQVRARDNGALWSEPLKFYFEISSPWFKSWWAILLFILAGLILILASIKIYHFHLIRQKKKLQQIIEARTREINIQKNEIIEQKNKLIQQKEELLEKNNAVFKSQQALSEADLNYLHLKEKQLQDQIEYRNKQITTHTLNIIQKNEMLRELREQLEGIIKSTNGAPYNELKKMLKIIDESFRLDKDWEEFKLYFEQIYTGFYAKLKINYPELTSQELRHCALIRLNLSNNECASILGISPNSIKVSRTRLRKKLNLEGHHSLTDFVMGI